MRTFSGKNEKRDTVRKEQLSPRKTQKGVLLVVSGASGSGKSTVVSRLREMDEECYFSISYTTRQKRQNEIEGEHYHFIDRQQFERMVCDGEFLEYAEYVGNLYGTPAAPVKRVLENGGTVLLEIEVWGAMQIRHNMPDAVLSFITPSDFTAIEARLRKRATEKHEDIDKRIMTARSEFARIREYDYIIINDNASVAASELKAIIAAERCKTVRRLEILDI